MATRAKKKQEWKLKIYVPGAEPEEGEEVKPGEFTELHTRGPILRFLLGEEKEVSVDKVEAQWKETISGIVSTVGDWTEATAGKWSIDEVTFGLTLSAEGHLLFIAKAGAQATVQVKVKRV